MCILSICLCTNLFYTPPQTKFLYTPANEVAGVYSDPYVRSFVRPSVRPSQSLIRYSSKTAEQNFMKLSGIVHYMMPYCTFYLSFYLNDFGVSQSKTRTLPYKTWGRGGYHFVSIAHRISSLISNYINESSVSFDSPLMTVKMRMKITCLHICQMWRWRQRSKIS